jgi:hypothetical protein
MMMQDRHKGASTAHVHTTRTMLSSYNHPEPAPTRKQRITGDNPTVRQHMEACQACSQQAAAAAARLSMQAAEAAAPDATAHYHAACGATVHTHR